MYQQNVSSKNTPWLQQSPQNTNIVQYPQARIYPPSTAVGYQQVFTTPVMYPSTCNLNANAFNLPDQSSPNQLVANQQRPTTRKVHGIVTKVYDNYGLIDNDVYFNASVCPKGIMPRERDAVVAKANIDLSGKYKWRATQVQLADQKSDGNNYTSRPRHSRFTSAVQASEIDVSHKRERSPGRGSERNHERSDRRSDESDRKRRREDKSRDRNDKHKEKERVRDKRSTSRRRSRSPRRRSRSPLRKRHARYLVKIPNDSLVFTEGNVIRLKKRYSNLYIPSDFFTVCNMWPKIFPPHDSFTLDKPCSFHIMHKECEPYYENSEVHSPPDSDYLFSAKVMLLGLPSLEEIYNRTISTVEELQKDDDKSYSHLSRMITFLVGNRGKNELMAIGGPWSPSIDGSHPEKDPSVLIKTAIRTCKALTGIDLSSCTKWYRFLEIYYHRDESVHKGKHVPARVETVVLFVPELWNYVPTQIEWDTLAGNYKKVLEAKLTNKPISEIRPADEVEPVDHEKEEELMVIDKCEPTHYSKLDLKAMKVTEIRQELESRSLSTKGLKGQLITRLTKALKIEKQKEEEEDEKKILSESKEEKEETEDTNDKTVRSEMEEDSIIIIEKEETIISLDDSKMEESIVQDEENVMSDEDKMMWEKRYTLPNLPSIVVHPSRTAKSGRFDCSVHSLSSLLDYRHDDNKEYHFEVSLFAEIFNEMLQRDFGLKVYKAVVQAPEKPKEDKKVKKKEEESTKSEKVEEKDEIDEDDEMIVKDEVIDDQLDEKEDNAIEIKSSEDNGNDGNDMEKEVQKVTMNNEVQEVIEIKESTEEMKPVQMEKKEVKLHTKDLDLLLAFSYFDRGHCHYILDKDLECLFNVLPLNLSRAQVRKLLAKVMTRDTFNYRKLTDVPIEEDNEESVVKENTEKETDVSLTGNNKLLPVFNDQVQSAQNVPTTDSNFVYYKGALIDVEKITCSLKRSEISRLETEKQYQRIKQGYDSAKETAKKNAERVASATNNLQIFKDKFAAMNKDINSLNNKNRAYSRLLNNIKNQINSAMDDSDHRKNVATCTSELIHEENIEKIVEINNEDGNNEKDEGDDKMDTIECE